MQAVDCAFEMLQTVSLNSLSGFLGRSTLLKKRFENSLKYANIDKIWIQKGQANRTCFWEMLTSAHPQMRKLVRLQEK
jgi:hypothetical protein